MWNESPDVIGWGAGFSTLIECKASRTDFLRDFKKLARRHPEMSMGQYRYYLCPPEIIRDEDLPEKWGLLWAHNGRIRIKREAGYLETDRAAEIRFLVSMLRRAQVRLGAQALSEWLRCENMYKALRETALCPQTAPTPPANPHKKRASE